LADGNTTVGGGAQASMVGTTKRSNGAEQVTYNGHPLYRFVKDQSPGDTNGEGISAFGGSWFAVSPAGSRVSSPSSKAGSGSASRQPAAPKPAPKPAPKAQPKSNPIPQNGGGDDDSDNHGGPDDGDGGI
jgi:hypothetical protein